MNTAMARRLTLGDRVLWIGAEDCEPGGTGTITRITPHQIEVMWEDESARRYRRDSFTTFDMRLPSRAGPLSTCRRHLPYTSKHDWSNPVLPDCPRDGWRAEWSADRSYLGSLLTGDPSAGLHWDLRAVPGEPSRRRCAPIVPQYLLACMKPSHRRSDSLTWGEAATGYSTE
jgi:hypothetical protein